MEKELLIKTLAIGIIFLFIGVGIQPIIAEKTVSVEKTLDTENVNFEQAKEYLFQTIIEISNNPKVKEFLNENKKDLITINNNDYDRRNAIQKIYSQNPRLLKSILFTKPKMTYEYLDKSYNKGIELINFLGEEESLDIVESVKINNPELLNELKNIIVNDIGLSNKIITLREMNEELEPISPQLRPMCWIIYTISFVFSVIGLIECFMYESGLYYKYPNSLLIGIIIRIGHFFQLSGFIIYVFIGAMIFSCWEWNPYT